MGVALAREGVVDDDGMLGCDVRPIESGLRGLWLVGLLCHGLTSIRVRCDAATVVRGREKIDERGDDDTEERAIERGGVDMRNRDHSIPRKADTHFN